MDRRAKEHPEVAKDSDDHVLGELSIQGIPTSPSADVAICLLICASDAATAGDRAQAAEYTARANGLIGKEACSALIKMIREADNEGCLLYTSHEDRGGHIGRRVRHDEAKGLFLF